MSSPPDFLYSLHELNRMASWEVEQALNMGAKYGSRACKITVKQPEPEETQERLRNLATPTRELKRHNHREFARTSLPEWWGVRISQMPDLSSKDCVPNSAQKVLGAIDWRGLVASRGQTQDTSETIT